MHVYSHTQTARCVITPIARLSSIASDIVYVACLMDVVLLLRASDKNCVSGVRNCVCAW